MFVRFRKTKFRLHVGIARRIKMFSGSFLITLFFFQSVAYAQECRDLETLQARSLKIGELADALEKWLSKIEGVPPTDSTYLEIETREAARQRNYARYETVAKHP